MGVPGLWPFIRDRFPNAVRRIVKVPSGTAETKFDYIYLDANGLLHTAAQHVFNYGEKKRHLDPYHRMNYDEKIKRVFELFFEQIVDVISMIAPVEILYIAIDGPAPRAKQNQQRERRFLAARDRTSKTTFTAFDSNSITPGTEFMHRLSQFMYFKIRYALNTSGRWTPFKVIFSPPSVPGEGEHKIMDYIRALPESIRNERSHCMFGPDGDLLMLTLASHVKKMSLFREDQFAGPNRYDLIDMAIVRDGLTTIILEENRDQNINDFIFMGFFVGNDFLPRIKMFYRLDDSLQRMIELYETLSINLTGHQQILIRNFSVFVHHLKKIEYDCLLDQATLTPRDPRFVDYTLNECIIFDDLAVPIKLDMKMYQNRYYKKVGIDASQKSIDKMCEAYLRNLLWVYLYYINGLPSWEEAYTYRYAPLMSDLSNYLERLNPSTKIVFDRSRPAKPFEQLLSVLPSSSASLLPEIYRPLMLSTDSPLVKAGYYPKFFDVDYEGKRKEHEGKPILPFVDFKTVSDAYNGVNTHFRWKRNRLGSDSLFRWIPTFSTRFKSRYGEIKNCRVRVDALKTKQF